MNDIWVCSQCSSINRQRSGNCYKCKAPQSQATGAMADVRFESRSRPDGRGPVRRRRDPFLVGHRALSSSSRPDRLRVTSCAGGRSAGLSGVAAASAR